VSKANRALLRTGLVAGGDPPRCPVCALWLAFGTDRQGRAVQHCECGYNCYVPLRSGSIPTQGPAMAPAGTQLVNGSTKPNTWTRLKRTLGLGPQRVTKSKKH
jgi:hypothetical protein